MDGFSVKSSFLGLPLGLAILGVFWAFNAEVSDGIGSMVIFLLFYFFWVLVISCRAFPFFVLEVSHGSDGYGRSFPTEEEFWFVRGAYRLTLLIVEIFPHDHVSEFDVVAGFVEANAVFTELLYYGEVGSCGGWFSSEVWVYETFLHAVFHLLLVGEDGLS